MEDEMISNLMGLREVKEGTIVKIILNPSATDAYGGKKDYIIARTKETPCSCLVDLIDENDKNVQYILDVKNGRMQYFYGNEDNPLVMQRAVDYEVIK